MAIKPILFSTPMVQAIMEERKTQTRRIIKPKPDASISNIPYKLTTKKPQKDKSIWVEDDGSKYEPIEPKYKKGDILWVRETWQPSPEKCSWQEYSYKADYHDELSKLGKWKPSIFMPKKACRNFLEVTDVRVERLHDISEKDAIAEGIEITNDFWGSDGARNYMYGTEKGFRHEYFFTDSPYGIEKTPSVNGIISSFFTLMASLHSWELLQSNPWVWVYEFQRTEKPENFLK